VCSSDLLVTPPQPNPPDGGFGQAANPGGGFGDGTFNTPVLVEAADTGPFFHNNSIDTIEGAVDFYDSDTFNSSTIGQTLGGINLEATEVVAVAAFLRVINALENARSANDLLLRARATSNAPAAREMLRLAISELEDELGVLDAGGLHPSVQGRLRASFALLESAIASSSKGGRDTRINQVLALMALNNSDMVN